MTTIYRDLPGHLRKILGRVAQVARRGANRSPFRRHLAPDEALALAKQISQIFGVTVLADEVQRVAAEVRRIERLMIGRVAGDVEDYVLYSWVVRESALLPTVLPRAHAEIGVLFGGGLLLALQSLAVSGSPDWVIGIDPFEGYYGQRRDPASKQRVRKNVVLKNAARVGLGAHRLRLIPFRSEDPVAIEEVSHYSLASLWIDGDHSLEGVQRDWQNYTPMVSPGGYVLLDDYHDERWPGVGRFVDDLLLPNLQGWQVTGCLSRSLVLRKTK